MVRFGQSISLETSLLLALSLSLSFALLLMRRDVYPSVAIYKNDIKTPILRAKQYRRTRNDTEHLSTTCKCSFITLD